MIATPECFWKREGGSRYIEKIFSDLIRLGGSCLNSNEIIHAIYILNISYDLVFSLSASNRAYIFPDSMFLNVLFLTYKKLVFYRKINVFFSLGS